MALQLEDIKAPIAREMEEFERKFRASMQTRVMLLDRIMNYIVKRKGKQMRPMFVFLSAGTCGAITESAYRGAALIELLHTATLVHDDVVDDANYRRGFFSINALWKNKIAVLVGDFLLSRGLILSVENKEYDLLQIVTEAVRQISEGELLQMEKARRLDIREEDYLEIIRQKTASLIAACCAVGATAAGADKNRVEQFRIFGEKVGMAFQIKDDLFDYGEEEIGKPRGIDIREKKMTLPLIHALGKAGWMEKRKILRMIKSENPEKGYVQKIISFVKESGGLHYATRQMQTFHADALALLTDVPESAYKTSLQQLVQFTIERPI
ncbi:MAG: polyprenyl synthetase family protein [Cyclobacteriaceae bacterium]|nr:polyprenyl synthetase family protein [Cyclobacteriaceae bacterium]MCX7636527.1 polyprenyl synthetase family protein [Cyclobacteriaceae bacterium]MDW8330102.1 polyprenyl synthetase family protein [Cyclobacteriaceae bacterium]